MRHTRADKSKLGYVQHIVYTFQLLPMREPPVLTQGRHDDLQIFYYAIYQC